VIASKDKILFLLFLVMIVDCKDKKALYISCSLCDSKLFIVVFFIVYADGATYEGEWLNGWVKRVVPMCCLFVVFANVIVDFAFSTNDIDERMRHGAGKWVQAGGSQSYEGLLFRLLLFSLKTIVM
jgi:hypothetical protein